MFLSLLMILLPILFFIVLVILIIPYSVHVSTTKESDYPIGKGNYQDFKIRFELINNWDFDPTYLSSLFCKDVSRYSSHDGMFYKIGYIHASRIIFNEQLMLLDPISYFRAKLLVYKKIKQMNTPAKKKKKITTWKELESKEIFDKLIQ